MRGTFSRIENESENRGASWSTVRKAVLYLMDSKKCFGIIRAALSLLKSVYDFPHNPKVAGSNPAPATICGASPAPRQPDRCHPVEGTWRCGLSVLPT